MISFVFEQTATNILNGTLDLGVSGNYYLHLVTAIPSDTATTVADLSITTATGYLPKLLSNQSFNNNIFNFNNVTFPAMTASTSIVGCVLCKRIGDNFADTDSVICFSSTTNSAGASIQIKPNLENVSLAFGANGAVKLKSLYGYQSSNFSGSFPDIYGSIYLLGTNNNTVNYTNPVNTKINLISTLNVANLENIFNRNLSNVFNVDGSPCLGLDFFGLLETRENKIKIGKVFVGGDGFYGSTINLYGSNFLPSFTPVFLNPSNGYWTKLSPTSFSVEQNYLINSNEYYRYLMLSFQSGSNGFTVREIEFYDSVISTPSLNMA